MLKTENVLQWNALKYWIATNVNSCEPSACAVNLRHYTDFESPYSVYLCKVQWNEMFGLAWACYGLLVYNIRVCFSFLKLFELAALSFFCFFGHGNVWTCLDICFGALPWSCFCLNLRCECCQFVTYILPGCNDMPRQRHWRVHGQCIWHCMRILWGQGQNREKQNGKIGNIWKHLKKYRMSLRMGTWEEHVQHMVLCYVDIMLCYVMPWLFWSVLEFSDLCFDSLTSWSTSLRNWCWICTIWWKHDKDYKVSVWLGFQVGFYRQIDGFCQECADPSGRKRIFVNQLYVLKC